MNKGRANATGKGGGKLKVSYKVNVVRRNRRSCLVEEVPPSKPETDEKPKATIPRISRLLALAHHIQELLDKGEVKDMAEVARLSHVTRARMTQIMNLLLLAPDIQEEILFLPRTTEGRDHLTERSIRAAIAEPSFVKQRHIWGGIR